MNNLNVPMTPFYTYRFTDSLAVNYTLITHLISFKTQDFPYFKKENYFLLLIPGKDDKAGGKLRFKILRAVKKLTVT